MNFCEIFCRIGNRHTLLFSQIRTISFYWVTKIFNTVDRSRLKQVGPDLACAEWLLKNGASVRFKGNQDLISDYNKLMLLEDLSESSRLRIQEVYANEVSLTDRGFEHFKDCTNILKMTFILCPLDDKALLKLAYVKNSLQYLELRSCKYIGDSGILSLTQLRNLKILKLVDLSSLERKEECQITLTKALPKCQVDFQ